MEACLLITKNNKPDDKKGKVLFINAVNEVHQDKSIAFLEDTHIQKIFRAYETYENIDGFAAVTDIEQVIKNNGNMSISLYCRSKEELIGKPFNEIYLDWLNSSDQLKKSMNTLFQVLEK